MPCTVEAFDFLMFPVFGFLITDIILHWKDYKFCHSPIQLFLLIVYCLFLLHRTIHLIRLKRNLPRSVKKGLGYFIYWAVNPAFIYLTIQGTIWQNQNFEYSPRCVPQSRVPWLIWWWLILLALVDIMVIFITVFRIIKWWKTRRYIRRIRRLVNEILIMDEQMINQILLNNRGDEIGENFVDQIGLTEEEFEKIPKKVYTYSFLNILKSESCPICCEEVEQSEEILLLPVCNHFFHANCIKSWLIRKPLCPMCRANVRNNLLRTL